MTSTEHAAGPEVLGMTLAEEVTATDDGWLVREWHAGPGLDGPPGILQGGLAVGVTLAAARLADRFGAPVTAVDARLHAPTPLERDLQVRIRPGDAAARHLVETRAGGQLLVSAELELAGHDPAPQAFDLAELGGVALPSPRPQHQFPTCWVCGPDPRHPHGQCVHPAWHDPRRVVSPWIADDVLADGADRVDPVVVAAVLDCPTVWACWEHIEGRGDAGALLGGYHVRYFRDAPVMEPLRTVAVRDGVEGRKMRARGGLVDEDGVVYAVSSAFQVSVPEIPQGA